MLMPWRDNFILLSGLDSSLVHVLAASLVDISLYMVHRLCTICICMKCSVNFKPAALMFFEILGFKLKNENAWKKKELKK